MASKVVVSRAHQVGSSRRHISGCGSIGEEVQCADRAQARGRQGVLAALKPAEDLPLLLPGDEECYMPAAFERRIGECDAGGGLGSDGRGHPPLAFFEHGGTWEERRGMPVWAEPKKNHIKERSCPVKAFRAIEGLEFAFVVRCRPFRR